MSHYGKCKHGIYLGSCRECFPLPKLTKVGEELIQELVECFNEDKEMTANELADLNEWSCCAQSKQVSAMLRQQAKEIAMLKQIIDANNLQLNIGQLKKELALQRLSDFSQEIEDRESAIYATGYWNGIQKTKEKNETLDTRSYLIGRYDKLRELTDEEILDLCPPNHSEMMNEAYTIEFARAIESYLKGEK